MQDKREKEWKAEDQHTQARTHKHPMTSHRELTRQAESFIVTSSRQAANELAAYVQSLHLDVRGASFEAGAAAMAAAAATSLST